MSTKDPFTGIWKLNLERSHFASRHRPTGGTMTWERTSKGYLMKAEGLTRDGKVVQERPQALTLDEKEHPIMGLPHLRESAHHPDPNTIHIEAKDADEVVGVGSYIVSEDRRTLIAVASGADAQQRPFLTVAVWDRQ